MSYSDEILKTTIEVLSRYTEGSSLSLEEAAKKFDTLPDSPNELGLLVSSYAEILLTLEDRSSALFTKALNYLVAAKEAALSEGPEDDEVSSPEEILPPDLEMVKGDSAGNADEIGDAAPDPDVLPDDANETSFEDAYPELNSDEVLQRVYERWLAEIESKPFYKTMKNYKTVYDARRLDVFDRSFLLRLIKAVSSLITHIVIEAELRPESIILLERYYDDLRDCMNVVVHSSKSDEILNSFLYVLDFLQLRGDSEAVPPAEEEEF